MLAQEHPRDDDDSSSGSDRPGRGDSGVPLTLEGDDARQAIQDDNRRTATTPARSRSEVRRDQSRGGEIDDDALAGLVDEDPDHAMSLLAQMRGATDQKLAAWRRLAVGLCSTWPRQAGTARGVGAMASSPADRVDGDLDLGTSLDGLVHAQATGELIDAAISGFGTGPGRRRPSRSSSIAAAR